MHILRPRGKAQPQEAAGRTSRKPSMHHEDLAQAVDHRNTAETPSKTSQKASFQPAFHLFIGFPWFSLGCSIVFQLFLHCSLMDSKF